MPKISDMDYKVLEQAMRKYQKSPSASVQKFASNLPIALEKLMGQTSVRQKSPILNTQIQKFLQEEPRQSQAADRRLKKGVAALMPGESLRELANRERQGLFRTTRAGDSPYLAPTPAGMTLKDWRDIDPLSKKKPPTVYESKKIRQRTYALESVFKDVFDKLKTVRGEEGLNLKLLERIGEK